jgi:hypothetical protein
MRGFSDRSHGPRKRSGGQAVDATVAGGAAAVHTGELAGLGGAAAQGFDVVVLGHAGAGEIDVLEVSLHHFRAGSRLGDEEVRRTREPRLLRHQADLHARAVDRLADAVAQAVVAGRPARSCRGNLGDDHAADLAAVRAQARIAGADLADVVAEIAGVDALLGNHIHTGVVQRRGSRGDTGCERKRARDAEETEAFHGNSFYRLMNRKSRILIHTQTAHENEHPLKMLLRPVFGVKSRCEYLSQSSL